MQKVYNSPRIEIKREILDLFRYQSIATNDLPVLTKSLILFAEEAIDFVDAILIARSRINKDIIFSFDKKLNKLLKSI